MKDVKGIVATGTEIRICEDFSTEFINGLETVERKIGNNIYLIHYNPRKKLDLNYVAVLSFDFGELMEVIPAPALITRKEEDDLLFSLREICNNLLPVKQEDGKLSLCIKAIYK